MPCPDCVEAARLRQERAVGIEQYRKTIAAWEAEVKLLAAAHARQKIGVKRRRKQGNGLGISRDRTGFIGPAENRLENIKKFGLGLGKA